ncbi:DUF937 domain-containing protein [Methylocapsa palsarum]|uniref:DUF937 domain-containing protein n=1 Tax=Methylocapsa palsarum TaxID=1612308 RepID=A0A1I3WRC1_9HYPH|nr:DUF937 domain-containing protein [Methylocapsa palsarum]SFK08991.1 hypothetical protein SAMN05444581_10213 [Methylocapsa palsarum]
MFNLYEILQSAHGGEAIENLAKQFNISPDEADAAVKALTPALSEAFLSKSSEPLALGSIFSAMEEGQHALAFADPAASQSSTTIEKGAEILSQIFGERHVDEAVVQRASAASGVAPDLLERMLPVIASMLFGGMSNSLKNQGLGPILAQLTQASGQGGLGSILGQVLGGGQPEPAPAPSAPAPAPSPSGLGGILGSILGGLLSRSSSAPAPSAPAPAPAPQAPGIDMTSIQAALEALNKMLQPGTPPAAPTAHAGLNKEIGDILDHKA